MAKKPTAPKRAAGDDQSSSRAEESVQAFRRALEATVTIPRDRLQDVVDDAVRRGRMTRGDAEELVNRLVTRGRGQADDILGQLERVVTQLRDEVAERTSQQRRTAERTAGRAKRELGDASERARKEVGSRAKGARKRAVGVADRPLATADRARRKARVPGFPISAYDQLSVRQVDRRLSDLTRDELRKIRAYERKHKARKGVLRAVDRKLSS
jgi:polyhydroxyalkanoate synthesis regulator phasin